MVSCNPWNVTESSNPMIGFRINSSRQAKHTLRILFACVVCAIVLRADESKPTSPSPPKQLFRGEVVPVAEALQKQGIKASAEELKDQVALQTPDGELIPILPDWRGRAFFQDERLRNRKVELIGYRRKGLPYLQVLSVYTFDEKDRRQYTDYWCDICSIPMYEIKLCDCCQQEIRLRFQPQELPKDLEEANQKSAATDEHR
jgi:hypothetical protein